MSSNDLFDIFNQNFQGFKYHMTLVDMKKNIQNEDTLLLVSLMEQKDKIMEQMREHALNSSVEETKTL